MTAIYRSQKTDAPYLSRKQASAFLESIGCPVSVGTLGHMAANKNAGKGPPFQRCGWRTVVYAREDLIAWAKRRIVRVE